MSDDLVFGASKYFLEQAFNAARYQMQDLCPSNVAINEFCRDNQAMLLQLVHERMETYRAHALSNSIDLLAGSVRELIEEVVATRQYQPPKPLKRKRRRKK